MAWMYRFSFKDSVGADRAVAAAKEAGLRHSREGDVVKIWADGFDDSFGHCYLYYGMGDAIAVAEKTRLAQVDSGGRVIWPS